MTGQPRISLPPHLVPNDGRFGSGPSRIPPSALRELAATGTSLMGTSHRKPTVKAVIERIRRGLSDLYTLPDGYEIVLGVGGATAFWDAATFGLIDRRSAHFVCGEFSSKFAAVVDGAPFLEPPIIHAADVSDAPEPIAVDGVDASAFIHNETSTGVTAPFARFGAELVLVDGTSAAGAIPYRVDEVDAYYFSPQKAFAAEGGLWLAVLSPAAIARVARLAESDRWIPPFLSLQTAIDNSRKNQTYNTPAIATLFLLDHQIQTILGNGGLAWAAARSRESSTIVYDWADGNDATQPFVSDPALRSPTIVTVDIADSISADELASILREHGIVDVESYRKLGRNQLRIATFPAIDPADVEQLVGALDFVIAAVQER